jgi:hypothetical protein
MARALFVTNQDMSDGGVEDWIVGWQNRATRNTEHHIYANCFKAFHQ